MKYAFLFFNLLFSSFLFSQNVKLLSSEVVKKERLKVIGMDDKFFYVVGVKNDKYHLYTFDKTSLTEISRKKIQGRKYFLCKTFIFKDNIFVTSYKNLKGDSLKKITIKKYTLGLKYLSKLDYIVDIGYRLQVYGDNDFISHKDSNIYLKKDTGYLTKVCILNFKTYKMNEMYLNVSEKFEKSSKYYFKILWYENTNPNRYKRDGYPKIEIGKTLAEQSRSSFIYKFDKEMNDFIEKFNKRLDSLKNEKEKKRVKDKNEPSQLINGNKQVVKYTKYNRIDKNIVYIGQYTEDVGSKVNYGLFSYVINSKNELESEVDFHYLASRNKTETELPYSNDKLMAERDLNNQYKLIAENEDETIFIYNPASEGKGWYGSRVFIQDIYIVKISNSGKFKLKQIPFIQQSSENNLMSINPVIVGDNCYLFYLEHKDTDKKGLQIVDLTNVKKLNLVYVKIDLLTGEVSDKVIIGNKKNLKYTPRIQDIGAFYNETENKYYYFMMGDDPNDKKNVLYQLVFD